MAYEPNWELLRGSLDRFAEGDVEWIEMSPKPEQVGRIYRGPIKTISSTRKGEHIHIVLAWCAWQNLASKADGGWTVAHDRTGVSILKELTSEVKKGSNGQLDFKSRTKDGTFYPRGQNLPIRKVKGFGPTIVKE